MRHGAIWDVDGTLVDTAELHYQAWRRLTSEQNLPFTRDDFVATFGWRNLEIIPRLFAIHDPAEVSRLGDRKEDYYRAEAERGVALLPGVRPLIEALHAAGFPQGIGSSAPRRNLELILRITGIDQHFSAVVAMEDIRRGKPDPEVFRRGAELLGLAPQDCLVFEDAPVGVQAARAAEMRCVAVTFSNHHSEASLREAGADMVVGSLEDVDVAMIDRLLRG